MSIFLNQRVLQRATRLASMAVRLPLIALLGGCGLILPRGPQGPSPADSLLASRALQGVVDQYIAHEQEEGFELRVRIGAPLDRIPQFTERGVRADARFSRALVRRIDWIDVQALEEADYVTLLAVRSALQAASDRAVYFENDLTPFGGAAPLLQVARMMGELAPRDSAEVERYVALLSSLGPFADTLRADLERRATQGVYLSRSAVARADSGFSALEAPAATSVLRLTADRVRGLDSAIARRAIALADSTIDTKVVPAFKRLTGLLQSEYATKGPTGIGLWQYVGGKEYYRALVRRTTTLEVTPEQVHDAGLREVARLDSTLRALRLRLTGSAAADPFHATLRRHPRFLNISAEDAVDRVLLAQSALPVSVDSSSLGNFPVVVASPDSFVGGDPIFGRYRQPSGIDSVAQYTPGREVLAPGLAILLEPLSYFAISPGRHELLGQRVSVSREAARWYADVPAFTDGWGLYALDLARKRGVLAMSASDSQTDSLAAYGALMLEMIAAVRLTVDSGIHYFGWTAAQASAFITRFTILDAVQADAEVARIAHDVPGLGLSAAMGVREMRGVRRWMERELKKDFDEDRFNRELHSLGPVPLQALGPHFEWWLWKERTRLRDAQRASDAAKKGEKR